MERPETGFSSKRYLKLVGVSAHGEAIVGAGEELRAECEKHSYHTYILAVCASMPPVSSISGWRACQQSACIRRGHPYVGANGRKVPWT